MADDVENLAKSQLFTLTGETVVLQRGPGQHDVTARHSHRLAGEIIDQKYKIISLLGEGGMGAVYKAHHILLNKEVSLKTFRSADLSDDSLKRFQREAQAIARLTHQNVVQVFDYGVGEDNLPYYTMEYLIGESLADRLAALNHLSVDQAARIFIQVCQGLSLAHSKGIIHRDLKPGNIFLAKGTSTGDRSDLVKIVDFGLAGWASQSMESQKLTGTGTVFGSPLYMSPEQSLGQPMTERSDIYSCGCALFEALTGSPPFHGENAFATMLQHQSKPAPELVGQPDAPDFPQHLISLLERMLTKAPDKRVQTFAEVEAQLKEIIEGRRASSSIRRPSSQASNIAEGLEMLSPASKSPILKLRNQIVPALLGFTLLASCTVYCWNAYNYHAPVKRSSGPRSSAPPAVAQSAPPESNGPIAPYRQTPLPSKPGWARFIFPKQSLGQLHWGWNEDCDMKYNNLPNISAAGEVFQPPHCSMRLEAAQALFDSPEKFNGFSPYDLAELFLDNHGTRPWQDRHMNYIARLTSLSLLDIDRSRISDKSLASLNQLSRLKRLLARFTKLTAPTIAKLEVLPRLVALHVSGIKEISVALKKLTNSHIIQDLQLDECNLKDSDLETIATMPEVNELNLNKNAAITNNGLLSISKLSKLSKLRIEETAINPQSIGTLKKMQCLKELYLSSDLWTAADQSKLEEAVPNCKIYRKTTGFEKDMEELVRP